MATRIEKVQAHTQDPHPSAPATAVAGSPRPPSPGVSGFGYLWYAYPAVRIGAVIVCLAIVALVAWLVLIRSDQASGVAQPGGGPVASSQAGLGALSAKLDQPIFWAGDRPGTRLEATLSTSEYAYVRYLTGNAPVGASTPQFLTVATYPAAGALTNLRSYAHQEHAKPRTILGGGIAVPVPGSPTSVYFARPNQDFQVEVYDPKPGEALHLIKSGEITPVPGGASPFSRTAAPAAAG